MVEILLSCHQDDYEIALDLKSSLQLQYDFIVHLYVEQDSEEQDAELDARIEEATVLFVFEVGESSISAWITLFGINMENSNYEQSPFPESIDFQDPSEGIAIFENILYTDFGLDVRPYDFAEPWNSDPSQTIRSYSY